jgi:hypothetical protein
MDEPRFGRLWRRRAFGVSRRSVRKPSARVPSPAASLKELVGAIRDLAERLGLKLGRKARLRLVHPEQPFVPAPAEPPPACSVRMDARGLQRLLEAELRREPPQCGDARGHDAQEPVRRSG